MSSAGTVRVYPNGTAKKCPDRVGFGVVERTGTKDHPIGTVEVKI
jgi:hypothetical protein